MEPTYIRWDDSATLEDRWTPVDEIDTSHAHCESLGWLVKETDSHIFLAHSYSKSADEVCGIIQIPKAAIVLMESVKCTKYEGR